MAVVHSCDDPPKRKKDDTYQGRNTYVGTCLFERYVLETERIIQSRDFRPSLCAVSVDTFAERVFVLEDNPGVWERIKAPIHNTRLGLNANNDNLDDAPTVDPLPRNPLWVTLVVPRDEGWPTLFEQNWFWSTNPDEKPRDE